MNLKRGRGVLHESSCNRSKWSNWKTFCNPVAKHYADRFLQASGLNYTILHPGGLLNEPGTGKIKAADYVVRDTIPREDVAQTAVAALNEEKTYHRAFDLVTGETEIKEALKNI
ncbi:NAD(P)-binding oxidoreductase [Oceanobacillus sp. M60]|uniref:NAD(P)-binding oxidoreductase n=1 Tax=Oceanobacillus TaxID=182709 RepID=UPI002116BA38|nr:NAD(P)-binding oxidoreductase [Oceanobacillus oncorhynchi]UUI42190.1 SDR family oxidoreductase [Oceanobacillus oncorhynchi]